MTGELFTKSEVEEYMRAEVKDAGGARKWLRKNKVHGMEHILHMVEDGSIATSPKVLPVLGFVPANMFMAVSQQNK